MELLCMLDKDYSPNELVKYAFEMSSGSIAEHLKPKIRYAELEEAGPPKVVGILDYAHLNQTRNIILLDAWKLAKIGEIMLTFAEWKDKHSGGMLGYRKYVRGLINPYSAGLSSDQLDDYVGTVIARRDGKVPKILASQVLLITSLQWVRITDVQPMAS